MRRPASFRRTFPTASTGSPSFRHFILFVCLFVSVEPSDSVAGLAAAEAETIFSLTVTFFDLIGQFTDRSVTKDNRFTYLPTDLYLTCLVSFIQL